MKGACLRRHNKVAFQDHSMLYLLLLLLLSVVVTGNSFRDDIISIV